MMTPGNEKLSVSYLLELDDKEFNGILTKSSKRKEVRQNKEFIRQASGRRLATLINVTYANPKTDKQGCKFLKDHTLLQKPELLDNLTALSRNEIIRQHPTSGVIFLEHKPEDVVLYLPEETLYMALASDPKFIPTLIRNQPHALKWLSVEKLQMMEDEHTYPKTYTTLLLSEPELLRIFSTEQLKDFAKAKDSTFAARLAKRLSTSLTEIRNNKEPSTFLNHKKRVLVHCNLYNASTKISCPGNTEPPEYSLFSEDCIDEIICSADSQSLEKALKDERERMQSQRDSSVKFSHWLHGKPEHLQHIDALIRFASHESDPNYESDESFCFAPLDSKNDNPLPPDTTSDGSFHFKPANSKSDGDTSDGSFTFVPTNSETPFDSRDDEGTESDHSFTF